MTNQLEVIDAPVSVLGEGPLWLPESGQIVWVDIEGMRIHLYSPAKGTGRAVEIGERIGAVVAAHDGRMVCALQTGLYYLDVETEGLELIANPEEELQGNRFNDGKCDPSGRFWAGTMPMAGSEPVGSLYRLDRDESVHRMVEEVGCSNGLGWSLDGTTMYYIDSPTRRIDSFHYEAATGRISNRRTLIPISHELGTPDGMTVDSEGMLWVAHWGGSCVTRWNPNTGECLDKITLPVSLVTSCCFGGENLDELYITSARVGFSEEQLLREPLAGSLFKYIPGVKGLPAAVYNNK